MWAEPAGLQSARLLFAAARSGRRCCEPGFRRRFAVAGTTYAKMRLLLRIRGLDVVIIKNALGNHTSRNRLLINLLLLL